MRARIDATVGLRGEESEHRIRVLLDIEWGPGTVLKASDSTLKYGSVVRNPAGQPDTQLLSACRAGAMSGVLYALRKVTSDIGVDLLLIEGTAELMQAGDGAATAACFAVGKATGFPIENEPHFNEAGWLLIDCTSTVSAH